MPDWSLAAKYPPSEITCRCGALFHTYAMFDGSVGRMVLKSPCPQCGKDDTFFKISSSPEEMTFGSGDVGTQA